MTVETLALFVAAASVGFVHTLAGPSHYLPFIALGQTEGWPTVKTCVIAAVCGLGHVVGTVILGLVIVGAGMALGHLELVEAIGHKVGMWLLVGFGIVYTGAGIRRLVRGTRGSCVHHPSMVAPGLLFLVFVLCPSEPLLPLMLYPAALGDTAAILAVAVAFGLVSIVTMVAVILVALLGLKQLSLERYEPYGRIAGGLIVLGCGLAMMWIGH